MYVSKIESAVSSEARFSRFLASYPGAVAGVFICLHFIGLSAAVLFSQDTLSGDVLEQIAWSRDPQWVYAKHPPLPVWIMTAAMWASGNKPWVAAMLGPLSSAAALFMVYRYASRIVDPGRALIATFLLEGVIYFNFASTEFNHNGILLPLWVLIAGRARRLYCRGSAWDWALFGLAAALGMLAKYGSLLLLAAVPLALAADAGGRRKLLSWGPAIAVLCGSVALGPHLYHLYRIGFAPVHYANGRLQTAASALDHLRFPLGWLLAQLLNAGPAILMAAAFLFIWRRESQGGKLAASEVLDHSSRHDLRFHFVLFAAPFLFCLAIQAIDGVRFRDMWGFPFFALFGAVTVLLTGAQPFRQDILPKFALAGAGMLALAIIGIFSVNLGSAYVTKKGPRVLFPARELAAAVQGRWDSLSGSAPLRYIAAESFLGGIFATYHKDHPSVLFDGDFKESFWLKRADIDRAGAILVWDNYRDRHKMLSAFPGAVRQTPLEFPYHTKFRVSPARVGWAILPPSNSPVATAQAADPVTQRPPGPAVTLISLPLAPAEQEGFVDEWKLESGNLIIRGWGLWQPALGGQVLVNTNLPVEKVSIITVARPDVAAELQDQRLAHSGFELNIHFNNTVTKSEIKICLWTEDPAFGRQITHDWAFCSPS